MDCIGMYLFIGFFFSASFAAQSLRHMRKMSFNKYLLGAFFFVMLLALWPSFLGYSIADTWIKEIKK